jgi:hypothetical protein
MGRRHISRHSMLRARWRIRDRCRRGPPRFCASHRPFVIVVRCILLPAREKGKGRQSAPSMSRAASRARPGSSHAASSAARLASARAAMAVPRARAARRRRVHRRGSARATMHLRRTLASRRARRSRGGRSRTGIGGTLRRSAGLSGGVHVASMSRVACVSGWKPWEILVTACHDMLATHTGLPGAK